MITKKLTKILERLKPKGRFFPTLQLIEAEDMEALIHNGILKEERARASLNEIVHIGQINKYVRKHTLEYEDITYIAITTLNNPLNTQLLDYDKI